MSVPVSIIIHLSHWLWRCNSVIVRWHTHLQTFSIGYPDLETSASIRTFKLDRRLQLETRLVFETRLLLEDLWVGKSLGIEVISNFNAPENFPHQTSLGNTIPVADRSCRLVHIFDVLKYLDRLWRHLPWAPSAWLQLNKQETSNTSMPTRNTPNS